jgi:hypothetical protein
VALHGGAPRPSGERDRSHRDVKHDTNKLDICYYVDDVLVGFYDRAGEMGLVVGTPCSLNDNRNALSGELEAISIEGNLVMERPPEKTHAKYRLVAKLIMDLYVRGSPRTTSSRSSRRGRPAPCRGRGARRLRQPDVMAALVVDSADTTSKSGKFGYY